jgi:competence protein ComGD
MERVKNQSGLTLLEVTIVLVVILFISGIAYPKFNSFIKNRETEYFIDAFKRDIHHMQQRAITEGTGYTLTIFNSGNYYEIRSYGLEAATKRLIPLHISFESHSMPLKIQFNQFGNVSSPGTMYIQSEQSTYKMVFQIGKGKFYVKKQ